MERGAFDVHDAAEWLGISEAHLYRMIAAGEIPSTKLGAKRLIARTALERLVDPVVLDLRGIETPDVARLVDALNTKIAVTSDAGESTALARLREQLTTRLAYAEALAAPLSVAS